MLRVALVLGVAWMALATLLERRRLHPVAPGTPRPRVLAAGVMRQDLEALAAPEMEGRRTGTAGGLRARSFVEARFTQLALTPLDEAGFARPFSFEHRSIKALFRRDRPFRVTIRGAANLVGRAAASRPQARALLVSAHYDHLGVRNGVLFPGADDNASGVAVLLALAAWVQEHPLAHEVVFAALDAEELGLRGANALLADPGFPRNRLDAVLNMDMLGRPEGGLVIAGASPQPELEALVRDVARGATVPVTLGHDRPHWRVGFVQNWTHASDHGPFVDAGFRWLYIGVEDHDDYHGPGDFAERVPPAYHAAVAEVALELLRGLDRLP